MPPRRLPATTLLYRDAGRNHARLLAMAGRTPPTPPVNPMTAPAAPQAPVTATVLAPGAQPVGGVVMPGWATPGGASPDGPAAPPGAPHGVPHSAPPFVAAPAVAVYGANDPEPPPPPGVPFATPRPAGPVGTATAPNGAPEAPPIPRRWWAGEDHAGALDLPPPPTLWEWWCEVFRRDGYTGAAVATVRNGPPPTAEGAVFPRPGAARIHRAWSAGWQGSYPAIAEVIRDERDAAHRAAIAEARARREAAVQQALDDDLQRQIAMREAHILATMREGQILDTLRGANLLGAANAVRINDKLRALVERSAEAWVADGVTLSIQDAVKLTGELGRAGRSLSSMAASLVETTRLAAGESTVIVGSPGDSTAKATGNPADRTSALESLRHIAQLTAAGAGLGGFDGAADAGDGAGAGNTVVTQDGVVLTPYEIAVAVEGGAFPRAAPREGAEVGGAGAGGATTDGVQGPPVVDPAKPPTPVAPADGPPVVGMAGPVVAQGGPAKVASHPVPVGGGSIYGAPEDGGPPGGGGYGSGMFG